MSVTLAEIRMGLTTTITEGINQASDGKRRLTAYPKVPGKPNLPALVVIPRDTDYALAMQRGAMQYDFRLYVLTSLRDYDLGQNELDDYVTADGPLSIPEIVWKKRDLGLLTTDGLPRVQAHIATMEQYGGQHDAAGVEHIAAILNARVIVTGRA